MVAVDVTGSMCSNRGGNLGNVQHTLFPFFNKKICQLLPYFLGPFGGWSEEGFVALIGFIVLLNEIAHIDLFLPETEIEPSPCGSCFFVRDLFRNWSGHDDLLGSNLVLVV